MLTNTGAFRLGDRVRVGDLLGDVIEKKLFVTRIRTIKNDIVTVPNGKVQGLMIKATQQTEGIQPDPEPHVLLTDPGIFQLLIN